MIKKKDYYDSDKFDISNGWFAFAEMLSVYGNLLGGMTQTKYDENDLGKGMRLVSIFEVMPELLENKGMMKELGSTTDYSFLFKDGVKVSDKVFRKGGMSNGYKNGDYTNLIVYHNFFDRTVKTEYSRTYSTHCLVDLTGRIVLEGTGLNKHPYYIRGVIASMGNGYYNLRTSEMIIMGDSSVQSKEYLFVQKKYDFDWYGGKEKALGVYKICFETGEVEHFK